MTCFHILALWRVTVYKRRHIVSLRDTMLNYVPVPTTVTLPMTEVGVIQQIGAYDGEAISSCRTRETIFPSRFVHETTARIAIVPCTALGPTYLTFIA